MNKLLQKKAFIFWIHVHPNRKEIKLKYNHIKNVSSIFV